MSHTPGPWETGEKRGVWAGPVIGTAGLNKGVAFVVSQTFQGEETAANARLISAAPDLLAACEELLIYLGDWDDMDNDTCAAARKAIAKAKGESK
jgi:hypothetical protein